jgi:hypothetical protein
MFGSTVAIALHLELRVFGSNPAMKLMKVDIERIYNKLVNNYYINNCHGRKIVMIVFTDKIKLSVMYSKLLLQIKLGRLLVNDETCDHIDGDYTNDSLDNLQVLSRAENARKGPSEEVKRKIASDNSKRMTGVEQPFNQGEMNGCAKLSNTQVLEIKELQKNNYRGQDKILAEKYGVCRATIKAIRLNYSWNSI